MKPVIIFLSPIEGPILAVSIQSLIATCPYLRPEIYVLQNEFDDDELKKILEDETANIKRLQPSNHPVLSYLSVSQDLSSPIFIIPPGVVFLKEGWLDQCVTLFSVHKDLVMMYSNKETVWTNSQTVSYPSTSGIIGFRGDLLKSLSCLKEIPFIAFGGLLYQVAQNLNLEIGVIEKGWFFVYRSTIPFNSESNLKKDWGRSIPLLEALEGQKKE